LLSEMYNIPVSIREELSHFRPIDNPRIVGTNEKIRTELDWRPQVSFEDSIQSIFDYWTAHLDAV